MNFSLILYGFSKFNNKVIFLFITLDYKIFEFRNLLLEKLEI